VSLEFGADAEPEDARIEDAPRLAEARGCEVQELFEGRGRVEDVEAVAGDGEAELLGDVERLFDAQAELVEVGQAPAAELADLAGRVGVDVRPAEVGPVDLDERRRDVAVAGLEGESR
jgi:hypothetical protein